MQSIVKCLYCTTQKFVLLTLKPKTKCLKSDTLLNSHLQFLAAQTSSALGTRAGVVRAAGGAVSARGHAGGGHRWGRRLKQVRASAAVRKGG